jgi:hypothetical protein
MAISRPFLLALLGAALLGATFFAVQRARDNSSSDAAPAAQAESAPQAGKAPAQSAPVANPEETLTSAFDDLESARFSGRFAVGNFVGEDAELSVTGAFDRSAEGEVPKFEFRVKSDASTGKTLDFGMVSLGDKAYVTVKDDAYRVPQEAWDAVVEFQAKEGGTKPAFDIPAGFNPLNWLKDAKRAGTETIDGVETEHVTASVDLDSMLDDMSALGEAAGQPGTELPAEQRQAVLDAVKRAELNVYTGADDDILRRARFDLDVALPGDRPITLDVGLDLAQVNEPQQIAAPKNVKSGAPSGDAAEFVEGLLSAAGAAEAVGGSSLAALASNNPQKAARAVQAHKKVVLFFENPRGLDDRAVEKAVNRLERTSKAVVLTDHVDAVERYGKLVEDLGVSQAPSIVIIDRAGQARLLEGYVDYQALAQAVADAR